MIRVGGVEEHHRLHWKTLVDFFLHFQPPGPESWDLNVPLAIGREPIKTLANYTGENKTHDS